MDDQVKPRGSDGGRGDSGRLLHPATWRIIVGPVQ